MEQAAKLIADWEEEKKHKSGFDGDARLIAKFVAPNRLPEAWQEGDDPLMHELVDTTAIGAVERLAALIFGFMLPPTAPWTVPEVSNRDQTNEESVWLDFVRDDMHDFFTNRSASWRTAASEAILDMCSFGPSAVTVLSKPFQPPVYKAYSAFNVWWGDDDGSGGPPSFYLRVEKSAAAANRDYPGHEKLMKVADESPGADVEILFVIQRRDGGRRGRTQSEKPWAGYTIFVDEKEMLDEQGFDDMAAARGRFQKRAEDRYGTGVGQRIYPIAKRLNRLYESVVAGAEKAVDPPVFDMTGGAMDPIDRRAGAVNQTDMEALGFGSPDEAIQALQPTGDLRPGEAMIRQARTEIFEAAYIDWMEVSDGGVRTATEVMDRRQLRFNSLAVLIARIEKEFLTPIVERTFRLLLRAGVFGDPPSSLRDAEISFKYRSPLAASQDNAEIESILRLLETAVGFAQIDPEVVDVLPSQDLLRRVAKNLGLPAGLLNSQDVVDEKKAERQEQIEAAAEAEQLEAGARALQAGGQGAAALINAGEGDV